MVGCLETCLCCGGGVLLFWLWLIVLLRDWFINCFGMIMSGCVLVKYCVCDRMSVLACVCSSL